MRFIIKPESSVAKLGALTNKNAIAMFQTLKPLPTVFLTSHFIYKFAFAVRLVLFVRTNIKRAA
jgi:uncharacterized membrane protein YagU involved in acid resistance